MKSITINYTITDIEDNQTIGSNTLSIEDSKEQTFSKMLINIKQHIISENEEWFNEEEHQINIEL